MPPLYEPQCTGGTDPLQPDKFSKPLRVLACSSCACSLATLHAHLHLHLLLGFQGMTGLRVTWDRCTILCYACLCFQNPAAFCMFTKMPEHATSLRHAGNVLCKVRCHWCLSPLDSLERLMTLIRRPPPFLERVEGCGDQRDGVAYT